MFNLIRSHIRGLITEFKRRNLDRYYLTGECIRMYIEREQQKIWINVDGSYVLLPKWYIDKEVDDQKLSKIIDESEEE